MKEAVQHILHYFSSVTKGAWVRQWLITGAEKKIEINAEGGKKAALVCSSVYPSMQWCVKNVSFNYKDVLEPGSVFLTA